MSNAPVIDPKRTALLVMDYQNGIIGMISEPDALLGRVESAITEVRAHGGTIGYVRVAFTEDDWAAVPETNATFSAIAQNRRMHDGDESTAIHERLAPQPGDIVVRKVRIGAMSTTDLDERLKSRGITNLVITGIATSGVVLSTIIEAADLDYRLFLLADGVGDSKPEVHEALVGTVYPSRGVHVLNTSDLGGLFG